MEDIGIGSKVIKNFKNVANLTAGPLAAPCGKIVLYGTGPNETGP